MELLKLSLIADGNVEWYSNLRKDLAVSYEVKHMPYPVTSDFTAKKMKIFDHKK